MRLPPVSTEILATHCNLFQEMRLIRIFKPYFVTDSLLVEVDNLEASTRVLTGAAPPVRTFFCAERAVWSW